MKTLALFEALSGEPLNSCANVIERDGILKYRMEAAVHISRAVLRDPEGAGRLYIALYHILKAEIGSLDDNRLVTERLELANAHISDMFRRAGGITARLRTLAQEAHSF